MLEFLYSIDIQLFRFGNLTLANPVGDLFFPFLTEVKNFYPIYLVGILLVIYKERKASLPILLFTALLVLCSDQLSSHVVKPLVGRLRPCAALDGVRLLVGCGGGKSFPSSHAVNNFAFALFFSHLYPKLRWPLFILAALIAYSRVYVGVHYPSDIFAGALLGLGVAWVMIQAYEHRNRALFWKRSSGSGDVAQ